jgi:hypothetical protein
MDNLQIKWGIYYSQVETLGRGKAQQYLGNKSQHIYEHDFCKRRGLHRVWWEIIETQKREAE